MKLRPTWLTFLSAVLVVLAFPPWNQAWLIWFALVPWFREIHQRSDSDRSAIAQGFWLSFFISLGGFYWVAGTLRQFAFLPWPVAILGLLLFAPFNQLVFPVVAKVFRSASLGMGSLWTLIALALLYAGVDAWLPKLFRDTLGHAFHGSPWLRQAADLGGAHLLTFGILVSNLTLHSLYCRIRDRQEPSVWPAVGASAPAITLTVALVAIWLGYGRWRESVVLEWLSKPQATVQMALIQANIGDFEKLASEKGVRGAARGVLDKYFALSDQALILNPKPDFVVWPETAYPSTFRTPMTSDELARDQQVEAWARTRGIPILFGGYAHFDGRDHNAFFLLDPIAELQVYRKNILLLFGEYIPGAETFPVIKEWFPQVGNFGRGPGPQSLSVGLRGKAVPDFRVGPIICYEALFPDYVLETARKGAQLILNVTNDSWFGATAEPELHLALTKFRSIEARVPQLRSTNTGISALILPDGSVSGSTAIFREEILNVTVPVLSPLASPLLRFGNWFGLTALFAGLAILGALRFGLRLPGSGRH